VFKSGWSLLKLYVHVEIEMYPQALSIYFHTLNAEGELLCTILIESRIPRKLFVTRLQAGQLLFDFQQGRVSLFATISSLARGPPTLVSIGYQVLP
jgi:hypothetical protein